MHLLISPTYFGEILLVERRLAVPPRTSSYHSKSTTEKRALPFAGARAQRTRFESPPNTSGIACTTIIIIERIKRTVSSATSSVV